MKLKTYFSKERIQVIAVFLVTMLICLMPLFSVNCIQGHDLDYHLLRIESLKEAILMGRPFLKINALFFGGRGYASSLFYPDFLLYFPAALRSLGMSINLSYHCFVALCFVAAYLAMYYCVNLITDNKYMAMVAAVIYSLAQYHLDDVYTRAAVGEFSAYIFIPFLLYGLYQMLYGKMEKPYLMIIGFVGVVLCHTITTILFIGVYIIGFILSAKKLYKSKKLVTLIISGIIVITLTSFYWMPVIEQLLSASFSGAAEFDLNYEKLMLYDLFTNKNPGLGAVLFVPLILRIFVDNKNTKVKFADFCLVMGLLLALVSTGIMPWKRLQGLFGFMQFPWRVFMAATPLLAVAGAIYLIESFKAKEKIVISIIIAVFGVSAVNTYARLDQGYYSYSNDYYDYDEYTGNVIGGEWLPQTVKSVGKLTKNCDTAISDIGNINVDRYKNELSFTADGGSYVDVPFIFYKGYTASVNGKEIKVDGLGDNGMCRVYTDGLSGETVKVMYKATTIQLISIALSIFGLIGFVLFYAFERDGKFPMSLKRRKAF